MNQPAFSVVITAKFLPEDSNPEAHEYRFAYEVVITKQGSVTGQVIGRHWLIRDANGVLQEVRGLAVVGHQPILRPGEQFQYESWLSIATPTGLMEGELLCVTETVMPFEAPIQAVILDAASGSLAFTPSHVLH